MSKNKKWKYEEKLRIVKEYRNGATISYLMKKYGTPNFGTVSVWNKSMKMGL